MARDDHDVGLRLARQSRAAGEPRFDLAGSGIVGRRRQPKAAAEGRAQLPQVTCRFAQRLLRLEGVDEHHGGLLHSRRMGEHPAGGDEQVELHIVDNRLAARLLAEDVAHGPLLLDALKGRGELLVLLVGQAQGFAFPGELTGKLNGHAGKPGALKLGIRPEGVLVERQARDGYLPVEVHIIEPLGAYDIVDLKVGSQMLRARTRAGFVPKPGETVHVRIDPAQAHFFDADSGRSLGVRL